MWHGGIFFFALKINFGRRCNFKCNLEGEFLKKNLIPLSRPIFDWGCIRVAWGMGAVSDRELCRLLTVDRKRLRERIERGNWTRRRRDRLNTMRLVADKLFGLGMFEAAGNLDDAAARRLVEFGATLRLCKAMIAKARAEAGAAK
jgi:hypothetical protein